jgi:hypothetical protein
MSNHTNLPCELLTPSLIRGIQTGEMSKLGWLIGFYNNRQNPLVSYLLVYIYICQHSISLSILYISVVFWPIVIKSSFSYSACTVEEMRETQSVQNQLASFKYVIWRDIHFILMNIMFTLGSDNNITNNIYKKFLNPICFNDSCQCINSLCMP